MIVVMVMNMNTNSVGRKLAKDGMHEGEVKYCQILENISIMIVLILAGV